MKINLCNVYVCSLLSFLSGIVTEVYNKGLRFTYLVINVQETLVMFQTFLMSRCFLIPEVA